jgi:hypothetical protein
MSRVVNADILASKRIRRLSLQTGHTRDGYGITAARRDIRYVARLPVESSVDRLLAVFVAFWRSMDSYRTGGARRCSGDGWT